MEDKLSAPHADKKYVYCLDSLIPPINSNANLNLKYPNIISKTQSNLASGDPSHNYPMFLEMHHLYYQGMESNSY